jgi:hypothetical protein
LNTTTPGAATPTFATKQDFGTGNSPFSVALGDFNLDGKVDLAIANLGDNTISVLLNTTTTGASTLTFAAKQDFGTGSSPYSVAIGDFNSDGKPDLVAANNGSNTVSVLLNTTTTGGSTPTFAAKQDFGTGSHPAILAVGDFNGDSVLDLAIANYSSGTVSVLLNTTTPSAMTLTFAAKQDFGTGSLPIGIALGDFNGDGKLDLAAGNNGSNTVSVLLNTTAQGALTPSFATKQDFGTGNNPDSVARGDFNWDGKPDLAIANYSDGTVSVLSNTTAPGATTLTFASKQDLGTGTIPISVAIGDLNGDGKLDLAVANFSDSTVSVLLNTTLTWLYLPLIVR